jgi:hypothetical protein
MSGETKMWIANALPKVPMKLFRYLNLLLGQIIYINPAGFLQNLIGNWLMSRGKRDADMQWSSDEKDKWHNQLSVDGYTTFNHLVNHSKIQSLSKRFSRWCAHNNEKESQYRLQISSKDYGDNFLVDFPEIRTLIDNDIQSALIDYYGCDFEVINIHLYRTRKPENLDLQNSDTAFGGTMCWHSDGSYTDTLKVFFLLSEVTNNDGPMLLIDRHSSEKIFKSKIPFNFLKHGRPDLPQFQKWSSAFTGKLGQCLVVDTNRCLHRASIPNEKPRDMVTFYIGVKRNTALDRFYNIGRSGEGLTGRF